jgi:hypothetical protein
MGKNIKTLFPKTFEILYYPMVLLLTRMRKQNPVPLDVLFYIFEYNSNHRTNKEDSVLILYCRKVKKK